MRPIQNAGGEETIRERSYPVAKATAITAGQVVQLSGGKVVPAAAAQTAAILGIAGEDHSGAADILNPRADGDEILVCDNPGLIFECPVPTIRAASGSAATLVPASGDIAAGAADDALQLLQHICSHMSSLLMTVPECAPVSISCMTAGCPATSTASSPDAIRQGHR